MNNFNDENESVRDTLNRVMTDMGYFSNPVTINTPVGSRTFYEKDNSPLVKNSQQMQQVRTIQPDTPQFNIRDDKNYAWDVPHKYDHSNNMRGIIHNFKIINQENPIQKPITTGSVVGDINMNMRLGKINPIIPAAINAYNIGYMGAGYYDHWQQAKEVGKREEY